MVEKNRRKFSAILTHNGGFSMIEIMVAISMFSIGFMALTAVTTSSSNISRNTAFSDWSVMAGQEAVEMLSIMDMNHNALGNGNHQPANNNANAEYAQLDVEWDIIDSVDLDGDGTDDFKTISLEIAFDGEQRVQSFYRRQIN